MITSFKVNKNLKNMSEVENKIIPLHVAKTDRENDLIYTKDQVMSLRAVCDLSGWSFPSIKKEIESGRLIGILRGGKIKVHRRNYEMWIRNK